MLGQVKLYDVLRKPVLTEKCTGLRDTQKKVLVEIAPWATKGQVSLAAKMLFDVDVLKVNTLNYRGKVKRVKSHVGKRRNYKRAYLTLKNGSDVDLFGTVGQGVPETDS